MKRLYTSKDKLIEHVTEAAKRADESKSEAAERLRTVSNAKLLRLARVSEAIDARGGRDKVVGAIGSALGRAKDSDYLSKLATLSSARLLDLLKSAEKRGKRV